VGLAACATASAATPLPKLASATVVGDRVTLTFTGALKPRRGSWNLLVNGEIVERFRVVHAGRRVVLTLPDPVYSDDVVRIDAFGLRSARNARLRALAASPANRSTAGCSQELGTVAQGSASEGPTDTRMFLPAAGFRLLGVRVDFPDRPARDAEPLNLSLLDTMVRDLSYGRAGVSATSHPGVVRLPRNAGEYGSVNAWSARRAMFEDLVAQLDPVVDFSRYDALVVTPAPAPAPRPAPRAPFYGTAVPAHLGQGITADGKLLRHFLLGDSVDRLRGPLLELAGLPVLRGGDVGAWDLMSGTGTGLLAWHRRKLGWLRPTEVRCLRGRALDVTLAPTWRGGGVKAVIAATGPGTAVVLENRQLQGHDAGRCARGVLPYRVETGASVMAAVTVVHKPGGPCGADPGPHDAAPGQSIRVADAVTFEMLELLPDGSYRLRVSR
jgi:hypothetical protein